MSVDNSVESFTFLWASSYCKKQVLYHQMLLYFSIVMPANWEVLIPPIIISFISKMVEASFGLLNNASHAVISFIQTTLKLLSYSVHVLYIFLCHIYTDVEVC